MPRNEVDRIAQLEQMFLDRANQGGVVAFREIGPTDRSLEKHIADLRQLRRRMVKNDVPRRMTGTMQDIQFDLAKTDFIAIVQPA